MKVLGCTTRYMPVENSGASQTCHEVLKSLARRGHDVVVVLTAQSGSDAPDLPMAADGSYQWDGITVVPAADAPDLSRWLQNSDVLVVQQDSTFEAVPAARAAGTPVVQLIHGESAKNREYAGIGAELFVYCADWVAAALRDDHGPGIVVHPPVVPPPRIPAPGTAVTLVNLCDWKGPEVFYALARRLPEVQFLGVVGAYRKQWVEDLPNVRIWPHTSRIYEDVYARTRILLVPSVYESYGRVAVEAAACGIPAICTPTLGLREAVGGSGVFIERESLDQWEQAVIELLDDSTWEKRSHAARADFVQVARRTTNELTRLCAAVETVTTKEDRS